MTPQARALDLFSGLGNFALPMARRTKSVTGIELGDDMVGRARRNAAANGLDNVEFHAADLTRPAEIPVHSGVGGGSGGTA